jgi:putative ABC transport system permease protein
MNIKFLPLIWSGITRKPGRTLLTALQVTVAFALFGVLQGMKTGVDQAIASARADLLDVRPSAYGAGPLPLSYLERIQSVPGVKMVALLNGLPATYQKPTQELYALAIVPGKEWLSIAPEIFTIAPRDLEALAVNRTGALITTGLEKKYGWKIGDKIPLVSTTLQNDSSNVWTFDVVGNYTLHELGGSGDDLIVTNNAYLDEARRSDKSTVEHFNVVATDPKQAVAVADAIDHEFANSSHETKTESYREGAQRQMQSIGDLNFAIRAIVSAVLVALLFSTATMIMQSIRERTPELATLKAVGFTDRAVFLLIVAEAIAVCIAAAVLGLALATIAFPYAAKMVPGLSMPWIVVGIGLAGAVLVALVSVTLPALQAAKLEIATALRGR